MINTIKKLLGLGPAPDLKEIYKSGAVILDVRSKAEFSSGHLTGAINIPVDQLESNLGKLKDKNKPVITCCASDMRSAAAKSILTSKGYTKVYNGGGWARLGNKLS